MTKIEWTDETWNPTTGCDRVSPGCDNCYALTMARRLKAMGSAKYQRDGDPKTSGPGFGITEHPDVLTVPLRWRKPRKVFVNSTSDLFHSGVSDEFIARLWAVMAATPQHTYQILTKRPARMRSLLRDGGGFHEAVLDHAFDDLDLTSDAYDLVSRRPWPLPNVHIGVSVEDQKRANLRIPALLDTPAAIRFLSCEPLLGPVDLERVGRERLAVLDQDDTGHEDGLMWHPGPAIDWVVVGGESGPGARPMHPDWARQLRDQCQASGVPFHFKQRGAWTWDRPSNWRDFRDDRRDTFQADGTRYRPTEPDMLLAPDMITLYRVGKKAAGRELDGRVWDEYPTAALA